MIPLELNEDTRIIFTSFYAVWNWFPPTIERLSSAIVKRMTTSNWERGLREALNVFLINRWERAFSANTLHGADANMHPVLFVWGRTRRNFFVCPRVFWLPFCALFICHFTLKRCLSFGSRSSFHGEVSDCLVKCATKCKLRSMKPDDKYFSYLVSISFHACPNRSVHK